MRYERLFLVLLLLGVVVPRATFVLGSDEGRVAIPIVDDGYYNMTIARNVGTGRGFTFDGTGVTTGFHPLVVLVAAPVFALFGGGTVGPLRVILALYLALGMLLGWMVYRVVRRVSGPGPGLAALLLYATSAPTCVLLNTLNGCDTVFGGVLLVGTVWYYLARVRAEPDPCLGRLALLGVLAGSLGLARLDLGFFAVFLGLDLLVVRFRRRPLRPGRLAIFGFCGLATLAPWIVFNLALTGRPLPDNGRAVTLISRATAALEVRMGEHGLLSSFGGGTPAALEDAEPYPDDRPPPAFYRTMLAHAGLAYLRDSPVTGVADTVAGLALRAMDGVGLRAWSMSLRKMGFNLVAVLLLAGLLALSLVLHFRRLAGEGGLRGLVFLLPAGAVLFLAYPLVVFGQWFFGRYYFPLTLVTLLFTGALARVVLRTWRPGHVVALVVLFVGAFVVSAAPGFWRPTPRNFYQQARHVAEKLPPHAVVGAIQAGHLAFFCPQRVVNLDGKVSRDAHQALRERRVLEYAIQNHVQFITDWPPLVDLLILKRSTPKNRQRVKRIEPPADKTREMCNPFGWATYVVGQPAPGAAGPKNGHDAAKDAPRSRETQETKR